MIERRRERRGGRERGGEGEGQVNVPSRSQQMLCTASRRRE